MLGTLGEKEVFVVSQAIQIKNEWEITTDTREGWHLWRTLDAGSEAEYVLSARIYNEETSCVMARAMTALLEGMSAAVILGDGEGEGRFAKTVLRRMGEMWPDSRLIARADGVVLVAIADDNSHGETISQLAELARHQEKAGIRFVGYRTPRLSEVLFANLMTENSGADIELNLIKGKTPMLRIRYNPEAVDDRELWSRLQECWMDATANS